MTFLFDKFITTYKFTDVTTFCYLTCNRHSRINCNIYIYLSYKCYWPKYWISIYIGAVYVYCTTTSQNKYINKKNPDTLTYIKNTSIWIWKRHDCFILHITPTYNNGNKIRVILWYLYILSLFYIKYVLCK